MLELKDLCKDNVNFENGNNQFTTKAVSLLKLFNMKKIILFLIFISCLSQIKAQSFNYKPFKVDMTTGIGASKEAVGFAVAIEPKYNLSNSFSAGLRWESAQIYSAWDGSNGTIRTSGPDGWVNSFVVTGEFYYWQGLIAPFIGGGTGIYLANFDLGKGKDTNAKMGFVVRGGFQIGHLRLVAENNFIPDNSFDLNYYNLKIGITLGGGKK